MTPAGFTNASLAVKATSIVPSCGLTATSSQPRVAADAGIGALPSTASQNGPMRVMPSSWQAPLTSGSDVPAPAALWRWLPGGDEAAVDGDVGAGDVAGPLAGEKQHDVGDLGRLGEPAGDHLAGGVARNVLGFRAGRGADGLGAPARAEPQVSGDRSGADRVDADSPGPDLLGERLAESGQARLGGAV